MTEKLGIDYSVSRPGGEAISAAGFQFVCRYLSNDSRGITKEEITDLFSYNIDIAFVYESTADRALGGYNAGIIDARFSKHKATELGIPDSIPIYFAVDFDATPEQQDEIDNYLRGCISVLGEDRVGVYGGYWVCLRCQENGTAKYFWQTYAWSGGNLLPGYDIYQYSNGHILNEGEVDYNKANKEFFGQWSNNTTGEDMTPEQVRKLNAVYDALCAGDDTVLQSWNANGNSLLEGYALEQQKLGKVIQKIGGID